MTRSSSRLVRRSAVLAGALALGVAGTAHADITGTVTNTGGIPIAGADIRVNEADGSFAASGETNVAGQYVITSASDLSGNTGPYTVIASYSDGCRDFSTSQLSSTSGAINDGAAQNFVLDALPFCATSFVSSSLPQPTGNAWPETGRVISGPGGLTYVEVLAPFGATGFQLVLQDGTVAGTSEDRSTVPLTAPAGAYNGPVALRYTLNGAQFNANILTLQSGPIPKPSPASGVSDLAAIVDVSGSMAGNDPTNRRLEAVNLLIDLAGQGDRLAGIGFDSDFRSIFARTTIAGESTKTTLKRAARKGIGDFGGTNYNAGMSEAFTALTADPLNPATPKSAIFLTDGANGTTYDNGHLRFAFNGTGSAWPICVVRLGSSGFTTADTARLQRIARETGGTYTATATNAKLQDIYFACRGRSSGAATILKVTKNFRPGQSRTYSRKVAKGQQRATFFTSWGQGKYRLQLVQPGGKVFSRSVGKKIRFVSGKTSSFFQVQKPTAGLWRIRVTRLRTGTAADQATTTVTVQKRR